MSITDDTKMGLRATVYAGRDEILKAAQKAAEVLGTHAESTAGAAKVTVRCYPGLVRAMSRESPVIGVELAPGDGNAINVRATIEHYRWTRQRVMWIPVTPKMMTGKRTAKTYLRALKQELEAIDTGRGNAQLIGVGA
jgi:hypothetical protein